MQREVLTIRTNIPRNSARNSLKMSRLRPNLSLIFLLLSFSMFFFFFFFPSAPWCLPPTRTNSQQQCVSLCVIVGVGCRLPLGALWPCRRRQADRRVKLCAFIPLCHHQGSAFYHWHPDLTKSLFGFVHMFLAVLADVQIKVNRASH